MQLFLVIYKGSGNDFIPALNSVILDSFVIVFLNSCKGSLIQVSL